MSSNNVVLVTGVSSGIGRSTAYLLARKGFRVFGTLRKNVGAGSPPAAVELVHLDVRDEESVRSCVRTVLDGAGRIDALVNNAGQILIGSAEETGIQEAMELFETNFFGALRMIREVLPAIYMGIYAASKHAPGFIRTDLDRNSRLAARRLAAYAGERDRAREAIGASIARGDDPARVASVVRKALMSRSPQPRYPAGRQARILSLLKKLAPAQMLDRGIRKQFGLLTH